MAVDSAALEAVHIESPVPNNIIHLAMECHSDELSISLISEKENHIQYGIRIGLMCLHGLLRTHIPRYRQQP